MKRGYALVLFAIGCSLYSTHLHAKSKIKLTPQHVPGEFVVQYKRPPSAQSQAALLSGLRSSLNDEKSVISFEAFLTDRRIFKIRLLKDSDLFRAIAFAKRQEGVEFAEPNFIYRALFDGTPNDPEFGRLWGMKNLGQADAAGQLGNAGSDIGVLPLWKDGFTGDSRILVAIIDTGIDWTHPELIDNLYTNPGESGVNSANGKDDDGNGFVDDLHGWNFHDKSADSSDDQNHGTHCAGTIGARGNNAESIAGVNWQVSLMPVKFLGADGSGKMSDAVEAINYARLMKARIMSNSWGGGGYSDVVKDAIEKARDAGILFVAAAGNGGLDGFSDDNDVVPTYPGSYDVDNVLAVAATDNRDRLAKFSNFGTNRVHVAAPGVKIFSTIKGSKYGVMSGTSMATPHVSGISALLMSMNSSWDYAEIKRRLIETSDPVHGLKTRVMAHGRVNAYNAAMGIVPPTVEPDPLLWTEEAYSFESKHPYDSLSTSYKFQIPGAKYIKVFFEKFDLEKGFDTVGIQDSSGVVVEELTGQHDNHWSEYVIGDTVILNLRVDATYSTYGFKISKIQVIR